MSDKEAYEKVVIKPSGLRGIRPVTSVRLSVMLENLIVDIIASPECNGLTLQHIADEIMQGLQDSPDIEDIKAYIADARKRKGNP